MRHTVHQHTVHQHTVHQHTVHQHTVLRVGLVLLLTLCGASGCSDDGDAGEIPGEGDQPTVTELHGYWSHLDTDGTRRVIHFEASDTSGTSELSGVKNVYHIWKYGSGAAQVRVQAGSFELAGGQWQTKVLWDGPVSCVGKPACVSDVGKRFKNDIVGFSGSTWTISTPSSTTGRRTYSRAKGCPAPQADGVWMSLMPSISSGCTACELNSRVIIDGAGVVHLFDMNKYALTHHVRAACGWRAEVIDGDARSGSTWTRDTAGDIVGSWQTNKGGAVVSRLQKDEWTLMAHFPTPLIAMRVGVDDAVHALTFDKGALHYRRVNKGQSAKLATVETVVTPTNPQIRWSSAATGLFDHPVSLSLHGDEPVVFIAGKTHVLVARRDTAGTWTVHKTSLKGCLSLQSAVSVKGDAHVVCTKASKPGGGLVQLPFVFHAVHPLDATHNDKLDGAWQQTWLGTVQKYDFTLDQAGAAHIALLGPGAGGGKIGYRTQYATNASSKWTMRHLFDQGGLWNTNMEGSVAITADGVPWVSAGGLVATPAYAQGTDSMVDLTVSFSGTKTPLSVVSSPSGLTCPGACKTSFPAATTVRLEIELPPQTQLTGGVCRPEFGVSLWRWTCWVQLAQTAVGLDLAVKDLPLVWADLIGGETSDSADGVAVTSGDGAYVAGSFDNTMSAGESHLSGGGTGGWFVARYSAQGVAQWLVGGAAGTANLGAADSHRVITTLTDDSAFVGLTATGALTGAGVSVEKAGAVVLNVSPKGKINWANGVFGGGGGSVVSVAALADGAAASGVTGTGAFGTGGAGTAAGFGGTDGWLAHFDATGNITWSRRCGTAAADAAPVVATAPGELVGATIAAGSYHFGAKVLSLPATSARLLFKVDAKGQLLWHRADSEQVTTVTRVAASQGGLLIAAAGAGAGVARYNATGELQWCSSLSSHIQSIAGITSIGDHIYVAGASKPNLKAPYVAKVVPLAHDGTAGTPALLGQGHGLIATGLVARKAGDLLLSARGGEFKIGPLHLPGRGHDDGVVCVVPAPQ